MSKLTRIERAAAAEALKALPDPALDDPDNPELTPEDLARLSPPEEVLPAAVLTAFPRTKVGRPRNPQAKQLVTLRLRPAVLEAYQAGGGRLARADGAGVGGGGGGRAQRLTTASARASGRNALSLAGRKVDVQIQRA